MFSEFQNKTEEYELPELITEYLTEEFIEDNRLEVMGANADANVTGTIRSYEKTVFAYDETENPLQWQIEITFYVEVEDLVKDTIVWKNSNLRLKSIWGESSGEEDFEDDVNLYSEEEAVENIIYDLGDNILSNTIEQW